MTDVMKQSEAAGVVARLADALADKRILLDKANDAAKEAQAAYDEAEANLFDVMEAAGLESIRTDRGLFRLNDLAWASVTDEAAARVWAEAHAPELLSLNRQRLSVIVRRALAGEDHEYMDALGKGAFPPGVDFKTSRKITWRRS